MYEDKYKELREIVMKFYDVVASLEEKVDESEAISMFCLAFIATKIFSLGMKDFMKESVIDPNRWDDFLASTNKVAKEVHKSIIIKRNKLNKVMH